MPPELWLLESSSVVPAAAAAAAAAAAVAVAEDGDASFGTEIEKKVSGWKSGKKHNCFFPLTLPLRSLGAPVSPLSAPLEMTMRACTLWVSLPAFPRLNSMSIGGSLAIPFFPVKR